MKCNCFQTFKELVVLYKMRCNTFTNELTLARNYVGTIYNAPSLSNSISTARGS